MKKLARRGHIEPRDRVWKAGSGATMLAADIPQLFTRVSTRRTWLHLWKTLSVMAVFLLAAAVTSPWSELSQAVAPTLRPWLTGFCIASLAAVILAGGIGFLKLDATYWMVPGDQSGSRPNSSPVARAPGSLPNDR